MICPDILCRSCGGSGQERLPRVLWDVLEIFDPREPDTGVTAAAAAEYLAIKPTAANNRLEALRLLGFLDRKRIGRRWFYVFLRSEVLA